VTRIRYPANGYFIDLPPQYDQAIHVLNDLETADWVDYRTSGVIVEVNTYHPETDVFVVDQFLFELTSAISIQVVHIVSVLPGRLVAFSPSRNTSQFALDIANIVFFFIFAIWFIQTAIRIFSRVMKFFFTYIDIGILVCESILIAWRVLLYSRMTTEVVNIYSPASTYTSMFGHPLIFWPLSSVINLHEWVIVIQSIVMILLFIRGLKLSYLVREFGAFYRTTVTENIFSILGITFIGTLILVGFTLSNSVIFGDIDFRFSSVPDSICTTAIWFFGFMWIATDWVMNGGIVALSILIFGFLVYMVLVPLLVTFAAIAGMDFWQIRDDISQGGNAGQWNRVNPIVLVIRQWLSLSPQAQVELLNGKDEFEVGLQIKYLPNTVKRRIYERRRQVRKRVETGLGYVNNGFDDYNEFVSRYELKLILESDEFVAKVFKTKDPDQVIAAFSVGGGAQRQENIEKEIHSKLERMRTSQLERDGILMIPQVKELSQTLDNAISKVRERLQGQLNIVSETSNVISETSCRISQKAKANSIN